MSNMDHIHVYVMNVYQPNVMYVKMETMQTYCFPYIRNPCP